MFLAEELDHFARFIILVNIDSLHLVLDLHVDANESFLRLQDRLQVLRLLNNEFALGCSWTRLSLPYFLLI
jgi:hypothetical protein